MFAPTNDAFAKIPKDQLDKVLADKETLTSILTYHVVGKRLAPGDLSDGDFKTLQGAMLTTSGSGESFKVGEDAGGGLRQRADRQRHRLHHRQRPDAAQVTRVPIGGGTGDGSAADARAP